MRQICEYPRFDGQSDRSRHRIRHAEFQPLRYVLGNSLGPGPACNVVEVLVPYNDTTKIGQVKHDRVLRHKNPCDNQCTDPLRDTVPVLETSFDKSSIIRWLQSKQKFKNDTLIYGIAFRDNGSTVIRRFSTRSINDLTAPLTKLKIRYRKPGSSTIDTMTWQSGNDATFTNAPWAKAVRLPCMARLR